MFKHLQKMDDEENFSIMNTILMRKMAEVIAQDYINYKIDDI